MEFKLSESPEHKAEKDLWRKDYLGTPISPHMYECYRECAACSLYVWHDRRIIGICPLCVIALPEFMLEISFGRSTSKKYRTALKRARAIPTYKQAGERHIVCFDSLGEYCDYREAVDNLTLVISGWKSTKVLLNGQAVEDNYMGGVSHEINRMRDLAGADAITFSNGIPIFTPKPELVPGEIVSIDPTHPANII